jgi:hypothetical protein
MEQRDLGLNNILRRQGGTRGVRHLFCTLKACRDDSVTTSDRFVEILNFTRFFQHTMFSEDGSKCRNKQIKKDSRFL